MWETESAKYWLLAYNFAKDFIVKKYPEEESYFETSWQTIISLTHKWDDFPMKSRDEYDNILRDLKILKDTKKLKTFPVLILTLAGAMNIARFKGGIHIGSIRFKINDLMEIFGFEERDKTTLPENFYEFMESIGRMVNLNVDKKKYTIEEVLDRDFEFSYELHITWHRNRPLVILDDEEIYDFRFQTSLFVTLFYLAAVRKTGDGWTHRKKNLRDPQEHRISSHRRIFDSVDIRGIGKGCGKEMIKPDRKGNTKLALKAHNIFIYTEIADFRSGTEKMTELLLEECGRWFEEFKNRKEDVVFNTLWRTAERLQHHYLPLEKDTELLRMGAELLGFESNHLKKYQQIQKRYDDVMAKLESAVEWHKRFSKRS